MRLWQQAIGVICCLLFSSREGFQASSIVLYAMTGQMSSSWMGGEGEGVLHWSFTETILELPGSCMVIP